MGTILWLRETDGLTTVGLVLALLVVVAAIAAVSAAPTPILRGVSNGIDLPTPARQEAQTWRAPERRTPGLPGTAR